MSTTNISHALRHVTADEARAMVDHPYVACCGDCGTRLYCPGGYDPEHTCTHARVQRDVHEVDPQPGDVEVGCAADPMPSCGCSSRGDGSPPCGSSARNPTGTRW